MTEFTGVGLLVAALGAGVLTVAAPCVLPMLPVIIGGTAARDDGIRSASRPLLIALGLVVSVVGFTLLLKASVALLGVPQAVWQVISGLLVALVGLTLAAPGLWDRLSIATGLGARAGRALDTTARRGGPVGDLLLGAALGPAFSSCSPTYALIVAAVLPVSFGEGVAAIIAYAVGLAATLVTIGWLGGRAARRLGWLSRPDSRFRRAIGVLMIVIGIAVAAGLDRIAQTWILDQGWYGPIEGAERWLRDVFLG